MLKGFLSCLFLTFLIVFFRMCFMQNAEAPIEATAATEIAVGKVVSEDTFPDRDSIETLVIPEGVEGSVYVLREAP